MVFLSYNHCNTYIVYLTIASFAANRAWFGNAHNSTCVAWMQLNKKKSIHTQESDRDFPVVVAQMESSKILIHIWDVDQILCVALRWGFQI
jgi:hypothetical protein